MDNGSEIINERIEYHHSEIVELFKIMKFIEEQILITEKESVLLLFTTTVNQIKYISFLIAAYLDLLTSFRGVISSITMWDKIYYSRNGFLAIYEAIKTYDNYQKNIRELVVENYPHLLPGYENLNLELKKIKKKYEYSTKMSELRNKAAGHYDKNYEIYYKQIQSINIETSKKAISSFANFLKSVLIYNNKIVDELYLSSKINLEKSKAEWELSINNK